MFLTICLKAQTGINITGFNGTDSLIKQFISRWKINGAAVAITKNGKLIYNKGFGYADKSKMELVQPNSLFRIASVSKPITSIAIMKMIEEGKLSLSDTVFGKNKILYQPYYLKSISDKRIYSITVQNLLEHTAGWDRSIPCDGYSHSDPMFFPLHVTSTLDESNPVGDSTLIKFSLLKGLNNKPGTYYAYSNIGYLILGKIIEKLSGMKYEDYVNKTIFKPLIIHNIHLGNNLKENKLAGEVSYFSEERSLSCYGSGSLVDCQYGGFNIEAMNAHGGWVASAPDLTKLLLAVDGSETLPDILNPESILSMNSESKANPAYAKGWSVNKLNNSWHTGSMDGTASFVCITNDGYTWAFLFNSRSDNSNEFWNAFDRLPWKCIKTINTSADIDLFAESANSFNPSLQSN
ncbi:MAG: serine hydrolase domain-containing protein [Bacteroidia bacterium]